MLPPCRSASPVRCAALGRCRDVRANAIRLAASVVLPVPGAAGDDAQPPFDGRCGGSHGRLVRAGGAEHARQCIAEVAPGHVPPPRRACVRQDRIRLRTGGADTTGRGPAPTDAVGGRSSSPTEVVGGRDPSPTDAVGRWCRQLPLGWSRARRAKQHAPAAGSRARAPALPRRLPRMAVSTISASGLPASASGRQV